MTLLPGFDLDSDPITTLRPAGSESNNKTGNKITLDYDETASDVEIPVVAMGGYSETGGSVERNQIGLERGKVTELLFGGYSYSDSSGAATANHNIATVSGGSVEYVTGGESHSNSGSVTANHNTATVSGGSVKYVTGGESHSNSGSATANHNIVTVSDGSVEYVTGGYSYTDFGSATADHNIVTVSGGSVEGWVPGGFSFSSTGSATANHNIVMVSGGSIVGNIIGGYGLTDLGSAAATGNTITISAGLIDGNVIGGNGLATDSGSVIVTGNTITISSGSIVGNVYGGYGDGYNPTFTVTATHNTLNLDSKATFGDASWLYGGFKEGNGTAIDLFTGNTLNVRAENTVAGIANFEFLNFHLPADVQDGDVLLRVEDAVLGDSGKPSKIGVGFEEAPSLTAGDAVTLIAASNAITGNWTDVSGQMRVILGSTLEYTFGVQAENDNHDLVARLTRISARPETKSLAEGYLAGPAFLGQATDFFLGEGFAAATAAAQGTSGPHGFAALGGGRLRHETGSHVDVKGHHLVAGLAADRETRAGKLLLGAFLEYGQGDYTSHNTFASGQVKGQGDTDYQGLGLLARLDLAHGVYLKGSLRGGRVSSDYRSRDLTDTNGQAARYDAKSHYASAHVGLGKPWELSAAHRLDTYADLLATRAGREKTRLSTGETLTFSAVDSRRLRLGARLTHAFSESLSGYFGAAWEREFDGQARATTNGHRIDAPTLKGNSALVELGLTIAPLPDKPLTLNVSLTAHDGQREGVTGGVQVGYRF